MGSPEVRCIQDTVSEKREQDEIRRRRHLRDLGRVWTSLYRFQEAMGVWWGMEGRGRGQHCLACAGRTAHGEGNREAGTGWEGVSVIRVRDDGDPALEWRGMNGLGVYFGDRADRTC